MPCAHKARFFVPDPMPPNGAHKVSKVWSLRSPRFAESLNCHRFSETGKCSTHGTCAHACLKAKVPGRAGVGHEMCAQGSHKVCTRHRTRPAQGKGQKQEEEWDRNLLDYPPLAWIAGLCLDCAWLVLGFLACAWIVLFVGPPGPSGLLNH